MSIKKNIDLQCTFQRGDGKARLLTIFELQLFASAGEDEDVGCCSCGGLLHWIYSSARLMMMMTFQIEAGYGRMKLQLFCGGISETFQTCCGSTPSKWESDIWNDLSDQAVNVLLNCFGWILMHRGQQKDSCKMSPRQLIGPLASQKMSGMPGLGMGMPPMSGMPPIGMTGQQAQALKARFVQVRSRL